MIKTHLPIKFTIILSAIVITSFIFSEASALTAVRDGDWHDPETWGGSVPTEFDDKVIPNGIRVSINDNVANSAYLANSGTIKNFAVLTNNEEALIEILEGATILNENGAEINNNSVIINKGSFENQKDSKLNNFFYLQIYRGTFTNKGILENEGLIEGTLCTGMLQLAIANNFEGEIKNSGLISIEEPCVIDNYGTFVNYGNVKNYAEIHNANKAFLENYGKVSINVDGKIRNSGKIINHQDAKISTIGTIVNNQGGEIHNSGGKIDNKGSIMNRSGQVYSSCGGKIEGKGAFVGNSIINQQCAELGSKSPIPQLGTGPKIFEKKLELQLIPTFNDFDGDGKSNEIDNCVETANSDQSDADKDGIGDLCDDTPDANVSYYSDESLKVAGVKLKKINSKDVCGDSLCNQRQMTMEDKIKQYLDKFI